MKTRLMLCLRLLTLVWLSLCAASAARAASSIMIWPVDPVIEDGQRATALWLENRGTNNASLQIRVLGWSQSGTSENFTEQEQVIASPPLAVIPAGQRQLVRIMNTGPVPEGRELPFRILVDELPDPENTSDSAQPTTGGSAIGVKLQIRYSLPLFVHGKGIWTRPNPARPRDAATAARPALQWRATQEGNAHYLVIRNTGNAHARLTQVQWVQGERSTPINPGLLGYVLPGTEMRWLLASPPPSGAVPEARVNGSAEATRLDRHP